MCRYFEASRLETVAFEAFTREALPEGFAVNLGKSEEEQQQQQQQQQDQVSELAQDEDNHRRGEDIQEEQKHEGHGKMKMSAKTSAKDIEEQKKTSVKDVEEQKTRGSR